MRTGIKLLESAELLLVSHCECGYSERCSSCELRKEIGEYLDTALQREEPREVVDSYIASLVGRR